MGKDEFCLLIFQEAKCDEQYIRIETDIGIKLLIDEVERFPRVNRIICEIMFGYHFLVISGQFG